MIITCNKCSTLFNLDDSLIKEGGSKCRCTVCNHIFTAYPLSRQPETEQPETEQPETEQIEPWQSEPEKLEPEELKTDEPEPEESEPEQPEPEKIETNEMELEFEESLDLDFESDLNFESALDDNNLFEENSDLESDLEMEDLALSSKDSDIENDDDFSFDENTFDMEEKSRPQKSELQENHPESGNDDIEFETIESEDTDIEFETIEFKDDDFKFEPFENDTISFDEPAALSVEKDESENEKPIFTPDLKMADEAEPPVTPEKDFPEYNDYMEIETEMENDLPEQEAKEIDPPPKKERRAIIKPFAPASPKPIKEKKKSSFRLPVIILLLIILLAVGAYIAIDMTGYKLPAAIEQYIKKPAPEISEARPIPNQKSVNGRFVTNSTAGTLFVITGRVENPSNIAYSHIKIRGALITINKEEVKIKNAFCGNIITEDMLKTGNISDIDTLLTQKEGAHKINVNVAPGASIPFMVVFSDLPEKLENFTIKVASFDKAANKP